MFDGFVNLGMMAEEQRMFNERFWKENPDRVYWTKENLLAAMVEVGEVLDELSWKTHRPVAKEVVPSNLREELVDIFKYWLNVWTLWGFTEDDLTAEFMRKSNVVAYRFASERGLMETTKPIVLVDIDGVLADYPGSFHRFVQKTTGSPLMAHSVKERARLKHVYRESGAKQGMDANPKAAQFVHDMHRSGYFVCALSSRPYDRYKRVYADTLYWMVGNGIKVDAMVFEDDKQRFVLGLQDKGKTVAFAVDDETSYLDAYREVGVRFYSSIEEVYDAGVLGVKQI